MMQQQIIVRVIAETDIIEAARWYEQRDQGLGTEFIRAVDACIAAIVRNPRQYPVVYENIRRALLRKFPFGLFFLIENGSIIVLACLHSKRHPSVFKTRK